MLRSVYFRLNTQNRYLPCRKGNILMKLWNGFAVILLAFIAEPAFAYLDPGTGSMMLQVILGGLAAVGVAIKLFWYKIRVAIGLRKKPDAEDEVI
jgi:hypothetical protein